MSEDQNPKFELTLKWCGTKDTPMFRATFEHCKIVTLFKDSGARIVTHDEFEQLIKDGKIAPAQSYWNVDEGEIGVVIISDYNRYSNTWDEVSKCKSDFQDGWHAAQKHYEFQRFLANPVKYILEQEKDTIDLPYDGKQKVGYVLMSPLWTLLEKMRVQLGITDADTSFVDKQFIKQQKAQDRYIEDETYYTMYLSETNWQYNRFSRKQKEQVLKKLCNTKKQDWTEHYKEYFLAVFNHTQY